MPILNQSTNEVYVGTLAAISAYLGTTEVWTMPYAPALPYAPAFVRSAWSSSGSSTQSENISSLDGDLIVVVACNNNDDGAMVPSSDRGGTFTQRKSFTSNNSGYTNRTTMWTLEGFTPNAYHTISVGNSSYGTICVYVLNKNGGTLYLDQSSTPDNLLTSSPYTTDAITPTVANSLAVAMMSMINFDGDGSTLGVNAPFGNLLGENRGNYWTCAAALRTLTDMSAVTATFVNTGAPDNDATVGLVNFYCLPPA